VRRFAFKIFTTNFYNYLKSRRKQVLFTNDYPPINGGGLSINVCELKNILTASNISVKIITSRLGDHFINDSQNLLTDIVYEKNKLFLLGKLILNIFKSQIIIINFTFSFHFVACFALIICKLLNKNTLFVFHTKLVHLKYNRFKNRQNFSHFLIVLLRLLVKSNIKKIVFSESQNRELYNHGIENSIVRPMPVTYSSKYDYDLCNKTIDIIYIGELSELKGGTYLLDLIKVAISSMKIVVIGNGDLYNKIQKEINHKRNIHLIKTLSHEKTIEYLKRSKYLFFPCINDSWGRIIFEAMYSQTKIIAINNQSGVIKYLKPNQYFLLSEPFSSSQLNKLLLNEQNSEGYNLEFAINFNNKLKMDWLSKINYYKP
jgi:hypothetical protein